MWEFLIRKQEKEVVLLEISHHCRDVPWRVYSKSLAVIRKYNQRVLCVVGWRAGILALFSFAINFDSTP